MKNNIFVKQVLVSAFFLVLFASCSFNPEGLAKDYCKCRADVEAGKKTAEDCKEMAESHFLKMQENEQDLKVYTEKVMDCISSDQIRKE
jgi:hypothetical protein